MKIERSLLPLTLVALLAATAFMATPCRASSVDDFQAWLGMNTILWKQKEGKFNLSFWTEARFKEDLSEPLGYFIGPGTRYRANDHLNLDFAIRFILFSAEPEDLELVRYQFAVTPHFTLFGNTRVHIRNRVEWITSRGDLLRTRVRHRFQLSWPIRDRGPLVGVYVSEEFFYNWDGLDYRQNRFVPLGLVWKTSPKMRISTYYMLQYLKSNSFRAHALGVTAIWTLDP